MDGLFYVNKKGKRVFVYATAHAQKRFAERYYKISECKERSEIMFRKLFMTSHRIDGKKYQKRNKKHDGNSLYYRSGEVTFVITDATIVTVEISASGLRGANSNNSIIWNGNTAEVM